MKALTISQPYASLIASGEKWVENRTWACHLSDKNIAIHAGKGLQYLDKKQLATYPNGCIIATAKVARCVSVRDITAAVFDISVGNLIVPGLRCTWRELRNHVHTEGPYCWVLEDVKLCEPYYIAGKQGLWDVPEAFLASLTKPAEQETK